MRSIYPEGLYFVGLDNHVGYLYKTGSQLYFIHSSYLLRLGVTIECAADSYAFNSSSYFITPISEDEGLVKKWLLGEEVKVQMVQ